MGLKHDIRRAPASATEALKPTCRLVSLQATKYGLWEIYTGTLEPLERSCTLNLQEEDRVVLLGDMIDRGPNSAGVVEYVRQHPQIIAIKGNHEQMAIQSLQATNIELDSVWMAKGGASTWGSYIVAAKGDLHRAKLTFAEDCLGLPTYQAT